MSQSIRIRTTPLGNDKYLKLKIEQDFDFIEILSLKISQDKAYQNFCSDYGVIVGRVTINNGFGVPNAKVSVFIPIDDIDKENPRISGLYPYETIKTKNSDGLRYNLLPKESDSKDDCYTPIGSFPAKREVLDNDEISYVFCKYYKYTTVTNEAGDFMIFGVPLGSHTVHIDADISNIGIASQRPYDFIEQGVSSKSFYSPTKFKEGKNLDKLIQVKTSNAGVNVQPFWGNTDECEIGISRIDFDLNLTITPSAFFLGSYFGDSRKNSYNKNCRPRKKMGDLCNQVTGEGTIEMLRKTNDNQIERFDIEGGRVIDDKGAWAYMIPCNLDYVITDEFGRLVPSEDETKGIPTRTRVRFRVSMDETGGLGRLRTRGKYLIPHNPQTINDIDFSFDKSTKDIHFTNFYWNKIYTVRSFIARTQKGGAGRRTKSFSGIKNVDGCVGDKEAMPFNRAYTKSSVLFTIICFIIKLIAGIVYLINAFLCWLRGIGFSTWVLSWHPFRNIRPITMTCPTDPEKYFNPGCDGEPTEPYTDCVAAVLAESLDMFTFDFYNDWINGTLYYPLLKYKKKRKSKREKFCEYYCNDYPNKEATGRNGCYNNAFADSTYDGEKDTVTRSFRNGVLAKYQENLYYSPIVLDGGIFRLFPTDISNLGSIFDCDWQGFPKIIQYLPSSSYKIPPLTMEEDTDNSENVAGIITLGQSRYVGIFYDINCAGLSTNENYSHNIRRLCELQVDIPDGIGTQPPNYVSIRDIYELTDPVDTLTSINRYIRDSFTLLNINGPSINTFPPTGTQYPQPNDTQGGTSFNIYQQPNGSTNGSLYTTFRNYRGRITASPDVTFQAIGNSYFVYFGIVPGSSALDKFKSKYLTPCERFNTGDFIIDTTIECATTNSATDGKITFTFLGGSGPFIYTVTDNAIVNIGPLTATTTAQVTNLGQGTYTITATDSLGRTNVKDVEMCGPLGLICNFYLSVENTCLNTPNGQVEFSIVGGTGPYNISYVNTTTGTNGTAGGTNSGTISNLAGGKYTFTVIDSAGASCTKNVEVGEPDPLTISIPPTPSGFQNISCRESNTGFIAPKISGGTPPYQVKVTRDPNAFDGNSYDSGFQEYTQSNFRDLTPGDYTVTVTDDSKCTTATTKITLYKYLAPTIDLNGIDNKKQCNTNYYDIRFNANKGVPSNNLELPVPPPFNITLLIDNNPSSGGQVTQIGQQSIQINQLISSLLQIQIKDSQGCIAQLIIPEPAIHRPTVKLQLSGNRAVTYIPNPAPPPATIPVPYGVITWTPTFDSYPSFLPLQFNPRDNIAPLGTFNNTWSANTWNSVIGTVTNNVGCTDTFVVPAGP